MALALPSTVPQNVSPKTTQAVVMVLCRTGQHPYQQEQRCGTAFHVGAGVFYTNAHVVKPHPVSEMFLWDSVDNHFSPIEDICVDSRWAGASGKDAPFDVAVLRAPKADYLPALHFTDHPVKPGSSPKYPRERVLIVGYPDRGSWDAFSDKTQTAWYYKFFGWIGVVNEQVMSIERRPLPPWGLQTPGPSGAAVLNESGEVIGIAYASGESPTGPILAVPVPAATAVCH
jgi:S1-C subfamily serine protease